MHLPFYYYFWSTVSIVLCFAVYFVIKKAVKDALNEHEKEKKKKDEL